MEPELPILPKDCSGIHHNVNWETSSSLDKETTRANTNT